jgi:plastocyanin
MTTRLAHLTLAFVLLAGVALSAGRETPAEHEHGAKQTITLDTADLRPDTLTMQHGDTISFANKSTHPFHVTFVEPKDLETRIRCGLVRKDEKETPAAPWALFMWKDGKLEANVPPGEFASVCSLEPGTYAFTAERIGHGTPSGNTGSILPLKGRIEVK